MVHAPTSLSVSKPLESVMVTSSNSQWFCIRQSAHQLSILQKLHACTVLLQAAAITAANKGPLIKTQCPQLAARQQDSTRHRQLALQFEHGRLQQLKTWQGRSGPEKPMMYSRAATQAAGASSTCQTEDLPRSSGATAIFCNLHKQLDAKAGGCRAACQLLSTPTHPRTCSCSPCL